MIAPEEMSSYPMLNRHEMRQAMLGSTGHGGELVRMTIELR